MTDVESMDTLNDDDLLPAPDSCAGDLYPCGKTRAEHADWRARSQEDFKLPRHDFKEKGRQPRPEVIVSAHIQTEWTCSRCGEEQDVWGPADEWMECSKCGRYSFLVPFMNA